MYFYRPDPVLWTKDGGELPDPERMVVNGRELHINPLNRTDNGTYRCEAENSIGLNSAEYVLIIHGEYFITDVILCIYIYCNKFYLYYLKMFLPYFLKFLLVVL